VSNLEKSNHRLKVFILATLLIFAIISLFPFYWIIINSFKIKQEIYSLPPVLFPKGFMIQNYIDAFAMKPLFREFINSLLVALLTTGVSVIVAAMAGYAFARYQFFGKKTGLLAILFIKMVPSMILLLPFYLLFNKLQLINNLFSLIIAYTAMNLPLALWLLMGFFEKIPTSVLEAGVLDGCGDMKLFTKVALPFALPGLVATSILCFIYSWNEFPIALVLTYSEKVQTLPIAVAGFLDVSTDTPVGALAAAGIIAILPALIVSLLTQKHIIGVLTAGAVKG
jgi:ABC-type glycerol-3-phosphate transport system permease component